MALFKHNINKQITLSMVELGDADEIFSVVDSSRNYLRHWLPWVDSNTSSADTRNFIKFALQQYADNVGLHCCIRYENKVAGIIGYHRIDWSNKTTELGYWLGVNYQGRGIMTKCCKVLTDYAFTHLKLNRVEIRAADKNIKSRAIPERLGFTYEGNLRDAEWLNDHFVNNVVYSMLQDEWSEHEPYNYG